MVVNTKLSRSLIFITEGKVNKLIFCVVFLCSILCGQNPVIVPTAYANKTSNGAISVEGNQIFQIGTVINNFPTGSYNVLSFRPEFYDQSMPFSAATTFDVEIQMSDNTIAADQMSYANSHSPNLTTVLPRSLVNFPGFPSSYPNGGKIGVEPWHYRFVFSNTFVHPNQDNVCITFSNYTRTNNPVLFETFFMERTNYSSAGTVSEYKNTSCTVFSTYFDTAYATWDGLVNKMLLHANISLPQHVNNAGFLIADQYVPPFSYQVGVGFCRSILNPAYAIPTWCNTSCSFEIPPVLWKSGFGLQWIVNDLGLEYSSSVKDIAMPIVYTPQNKIECQTISNKGLLPYTWMSVIQRID